MSGDPFIEFPCITTSRLKLRKLIEADLQEFLPIARWKDTALSPEAILEIIRKSEADYQSRESINWCLIFEGQLIGTCGYYRGFKNNIGEVGYAMNADFRGRGLMKEAVKAITEFGFSQLNLDRVVAYTGKENVASVKLLEGLRFVETTDQIEGLTKFEKDAVSIGDEAYAKTI